MATPSYYMLGVFLYSIVFDVFISLHIFFRKNLSVFKKHVSLHSQKGKINLFYFSNIAGPIAQLVRVADS